MCKYLNKKNTHTSQVIPFNTLQDYPMGPSHGIKCKGTEITLIEYADSVTSVAYVRLVNIKIAAECKTPDILIYNQYFTWIHSSVLWDYPMGPSHGIKCKGIEITLIKHTDSIAPFPSVR